MTFTCFKPELIVFDLDGTLVDSSPDIASAINNMLSSLDLHTHPEQQIRHWMGSGARKLIKRALTGNFEPTTEPGNYAEAEQIFYDFYARNVCQHSRLYRGVQEGLQQLKAADIKLACVTNKPAQFTTPLLADIGLLDYFQFIASGDTYHAMKPDPFPLMEAAKATATTSERALMVGDSVNDIQAGKRAGFKTAVVPYGYIGRHTVAELDADYQVDSIAHLAALFCS